MMDGWTMYLLLKYYCNTDQPQLNLVFVTFHWSSANAIPEGKLTDTSPALELRTPLSTPPKHNRIETGKRGKRNRVGVKNQIASVLYATCSIHVDSKLSQAQYFRLSSLLCFSSRRGAGKKGLALCLFHHGQPK